MLKDWPKRFLTLDLKYFERQLEYFKKSYNVITLNEYYNIKSGSSVSPQNPLVITIDDGYLDNWIWAFPLLKKYNLPATIFVSPEMVDTRSIVRPNLEDLWKGKTTKGELSVNGYMSWDEMKIMTTNGLINFQSHTMSHTKYFVSDRITGFHHPGADCIYPIGNLFPELKPFYISNPDFEKKVPYGTPFFEWRSSIVAKKVDINPDFVNECVQALKGLDLSNYDFKTAFNKVEPVYNDYRKDGKIILSTESDEAHKKRVLYELVDSKNIIEEKLNTKVEFLAWPHGDHTEELHELALKSGYKATTTGNLKAGERSDRIGPRIGIRIYYKNLMFDTMRLDLKIKAFKGNGVAGFVKSIYKAFKGG